MKSFVKSDCTKLHEYSKLKLNAGKKEPLLCYVLFLLFLNRD